MEKLFIWGDNIPYNSLRSKSEDMILKKKYTTFCMIRGFMSIFSKKLDKTRVYLDSMTWNDEIKKGEGAETYEDRPYLIPFLAKGSSRAVIIAPGGGFCTKSMEDEGTKTAKMLNSYGISAFVLWYRLNPYRDPVPYLDMQRAIRYVRFHADDFGIHPGKIGIMGFSAGGYVAGASMLRLKNKQVECEGYQKDAIDDTDAGVAFAALLYPVVEFENSKNMLSLLIGDAIYDTAKCKAAVEEYSLLNHVKGCKVPQFLCYGSRETLSGMPEYGQKMKMEREDNQVVVVSGAGHGFGIDEHRKHSLYWPAKFADWINRVCPNG